MMNFSETTEKFADLQPGTVFLSDKFSDPKNQKNRRIFEKIGNELIHEKIYIQVVADIIYYGNARRKNDGMLFNFSEEDKVFPEILV